MPSCCAFSCISSFICLSTSENATQHYQCQTWTGKLQTLLGLGFCVFTMLSFNFVLQIYRILNYIAFRFCAAVASPLGHLFREGTTSLGIRGLLSAYRTFTLNFSNKGHITPHIVLPFEQKIKSFCWVM